MPKPRILIFCKAPIAGEVKTRLIPSMGVDAATELHQQLATRIILECLNPDVSAVADIELWCSPTTDHEFYRQFEVQKCQQQGEDLGQRMANAFEATGVPALLIGTDCVNLDGNYLRLAVDKLTTHDAVIGPAEDGGYGLIGLHEGNRDLFEGINWGSETVCSETCRKMNTQQLNFALLPLLWDVDRPDDVERLNRLKQHPVQ